MILLEQKLDIHTFPETHIQNLYIQLQGILCHFPRSFQKTDSFPTNTSKSITHAHLNACNNCFKWSEIFLPQLVQWPTTGWTVQGLNLGEDKILSRCPDWPRGPPSFLYNGYWVSFPGVKQSDHSEDHPPPSCAYVFYELLLYLCSVFSRHIIGWLLP
jgi:hypothetical protein